jgi:hypothetical protein
MTRHQIFCLPLLTALVWASACFVESETPLPVEFGQCPDRADQELPVPDRLLTYHGDVKPIIDAKCATCHRQGDVAPFSLETYADVFMFREDMRYAIQTGIMPPWQPDECCNHYRWDRSLTAEQTAALLSWIDQGAQPGDPENPASPLDIDNGGLSRVDLTITMPEPFTPEPVIGRDEIRCFLLDWPVDRDIYVTGLNVAPGNRSMVHHVIVFTVDDADVDALRAQDAQDDRPGWDCHGQSGGEARPTGSLGGWAPGYRGVEFPDGLGHKVPAGSSIVLNMHYDTSSGAGQDQTSIEFQLADQVTQELEGLAIGNPLWLIGDGMQIDAGDPDAMAFFSYDPTVLTTKGRPFLIYAINHHMHELGSIARMAILRADGSTECLLNITDWDFDWLGEYYFEQPVLLEPGDELYIECHWDNTAANQKIVNGEQQAPRDIRWGTDDEMCAGILTGITL